MEILEYKSEYFNVKDTLDCGQIFRYKLINDYFLVVSGDKACRVCQKGDITVIECCDGEYFKNFFDLERDYTKVNERALKLNYGIVQKAAKAGKGIRILNQQKEEMLFSFIISQNNINK